MDFTVCISGTSLRHQPPHTPQPPPNPRRGEVCPRLLPQAALYTDKYFNAISLLGNNFRRHLQRNGLTGRRNQEERFTLRAGRGVHNSFWFKHLICDSKPNEQKPWKPWIFCTNFSSVWLLKKYNSKAANMRINYIHERKNNLLWGFISWRGFLSKRKKEKKVAFNKFTWSRYISYITLRLPL